MAFKKRLCKILSRISGNHKLIAPQYIFEVREDAVFALWLQANTTKEDGSVHAADMRPDYALEAQTWSDQTKQILERAKQFYAKYETPNHSAWERICARPFHAEEDAKEWAYLQKALAPQFAKVWEQEQPLLLRWKEILEKEDYSRFADGFRRVRILLRAKARHQKPLRVILVPSKETRHASGRTHMGIDDCALLALSHLEESRKENALNCLFHEHFHILSRASPSNEKLLRSSWGKHMRHLRLRLKSSKWKYLFEESQIAPLAGTLMCNYMGAYFIAESEREKIAKIILKNALRSGKVAYQALIHIVSVRTLDSFKKYLEEEKRFDAALGRDIAKAWIAVLAEHKKPLVEMGEMEDQE